MIYINLKEYLKFKKGKKGKIYIYIEYNFLNIIWFFFRIYEKKMNILVKIIIMYLFRYIFLNYFGIKKIVKRLIKENVEIYRLMLGR